MYAAAAAVAAVVQVHTTTRGCWCAPPAWCSTGTAGTSRRGRHTVVPNGKNPPKLRSKKYREIDLSYLCLQQLYEFLIASASNE